MTACPDGFSADGDFTIADSDCPVHNLAMTVTWWIVFGLGVVCLGTSLLKSWQVPREQRASHVFALAVMGSAEGALTILTAALKLFLKQNIGRSFGISIAYLLWSVTFWLCKSVRCPASCLMM